jgi:hypothetical protein
LTRENKRPCETLAKLEKGPEGVSPQVEPRQERLVSGRREYRNPVS